MAKTERQSRSKKRKQGLKYPISGDPTTEPKAAAEMHIRALGATTYCHALLPHIRDLLNGFDIPLTAHQLIDWLMREMAPRDALEEMLAVQALLAHVRVLHLTRLSGTQTEIKAIQTVNEYADRASNTFRKLMLALPEYRRPPRSGDSFTAIKQANIANQQVVQNEKSQTEGTTNEQGLPAGATPALPADSGGPGLAEVLSEAEQAVGAQLRADDR